MGHTYATIAFDAVKCDGCLKCMSACASAKTGTEDVARARIQVMPTAYGFELAMCRQCGDPKCVTVCPAGALAKNAGKRRDRMGWRQMRRLPAVHHGLRLRRHRPDAVDGRVAKCDMCEGAPACVSACPTGRAAATSRPRASTTRSASWEDMFAPGLAGCQGCNTELLMRHTLRRVGPDAVLATPPGCVPGHGLGRLQRPHRHQGSGLSPAADQYRLDAGRRRASYKRKGREVTAMAIAGDGGASDVGFQSLSGAAERGEEILFMVVDNEGYMNTGMQRSSCTPYGAWTSTTPVGRAQSKARRRTRRTCRC